MKNDLIGVRDIYTFTMVLFMIIGIIEDSLWTYLIAMIIAMVSIFINIMVTQKEKIREFNSKKRE